jgi:putative tryptophan/tyrosine transport system substrate-binding protein
MLATFLALILAVLLIAMPAGAEQQASIPTVGWLVFDAGEGGLDGFHQGLRELGYVEGRDIAIEARSPAGTGDRLAEQIEELARLKVKIIVTGGVPATLAAKRAAWPIPVVFIMADPVGSGVVASLAHPGGTMTGQSLAIEEQFAGKWLELLKEAAPRLSRVAFLWNPANHSSASSWKTMQGLAPTVGLTLQSVELRDPKDIGEALAAIVRDRAEGVIVDSDPVTGSNKTRIVEFAAAHHLPALEVVCRCRRPDVVWAELLRAVAARRHLRRQDPQRRKPRRLAGRAADQIRARYQSEDCAGARPHDPALASTARR